MEKTVIAVTPFACLTGCKINSNRLRKSRYGALYIKFVGTHKQYDAVDADTVETE